MKYILFVLTLTLGMLASNPVSAQTGICGRTELVQAVILAEVPTAATCEAVTAQDFSQITELDINFGYILTSLQAGDFAGLDSLVRLNLGNNQLTTLPAGLFAGLDSLVRLNLGSNELTTLPASLFAGLDSLVRLNLGSNELTTLPASLFAGLDSLVRLNLGHNELTTLPARLFAGLDSLIGLSLQGNQLTTLPAGLFAGLSLDYLLLGWNQLTTLPASLFAGIDRLVHLQLSHNELTTLPASLFTGLDSLRALNLDFNEFTTLPASLFAGLDGLNVLNLNGNQFTTLPAGLFAGLASLGALRLAVNQLTTLSADIFAGLSNLDYLDLAENQLTMLPACLFAGLDRLESLDLGGDQLPTLSNVRYYGDRLKTLLMGELRDGCMSTRMGYLENPGPNSFQSGIGTISGWVCEANEVIIELNGQAHTAAYGTERLDTREVCGDTDNGFGLLFNWNRLGFGDHEVVATVDGEELGRATVTVTTLGTDFLRGAAGTCTVEDFPSPGERVMVVWQQAQQSFVLATDTAPAGVNQPGIAGVGYLENPGPNSFQSGIGTISGWVCEAGEVVLEVGDLAPQVAAYGTERRDTLEVCGDTDNGFGLLFNWNRLGDGDHEVVATVDGEELGRATVQVTTLGEEFLRGGAGMCTVEDFPRPSKRVTLTWQQNSQNFVITAVE